MGLYGAKESMNNKAVFLDSDGTINKDKHYLYKVSEFEYLEGVIGGLKKLYDYGFILVIITNQSGIARGYYSEADYYSLDAWMKKDLNDKGIEIKASYFCPHLPNGIVPRYSTECGCRKPKTELFWKAAKDLNIDMNRSYAVGDKLRDLCICEESGVKGILLSDDSYNDSKYTVCPDWDGIVNYIIKNEEDMKIDQ